MFGCGLFVSCLVRMCMCLCVSLVDLCFRLFVCFGLCLCVCVCVRWFVYLVWVFARVCMCVVHGRLCFCFVCLYVCLFICLGRFVDLCVVRCLCFFVLRVCE